jgi:hypothetical protein
VSDVNIEMRTNDDGMSLSPDHTGFVSGQADERVLTNLAEIRGNIRCET